MRTILTVFFPILALASCQGGKKSSQKINQELLYQPWKVAFISTPEKLATGKEMGDPIYEFTRTGQRYKIFETPPHKDSVRYELRNDSLFYPENPKLPAAKITKLSKDSLVLRSEKADWHLFR